MPIRVPNIVDNKILNVFPNIPWENYKAKATVGFNIPVVKCSVVCIPTKADPATNKLPSKSPIFFSLAFKNDRINSQEEKHSIPM